MKLDTEVIKVLTNSLHKLKVYKAFFKRFIYLFKRKRGHVTGGGAKGGRDSQADAPRNVEPDGGSIPWRTRSRPEPTPRVRR